MTTIVRTKEINLTVVVENFLIHKEMSLDHTGKAIAENESTVIGTAVKKVTEDYIIMIEIAQDEIIIEETLMTDTKNLEKGGQESGPIVVNVDIIVVITKGKFTKILDEKFIGGMTQVTLKEIDVTIKVVEDEAIQEIESTPGENENLTSILTSRKKPKQMLLQTLTNTATNCFGMVFSGSARCRD